VPQREHFIPFSRADVVGLCLRSGRLRADEQQGFSQLCGLLAAVFHFEFHARVEELKALYAPFNPDLDTRQSPGAAAGAAAGGPPGDLAERRARFVEALAELLERANYARLSPEDLNRALQEESAFGLRLHVELDDFEELALFARGLRRDRVAVKGRWPWSAPREMDIEAWERVAVWARFRPAEHFDSKRRGSLAFTPGATILKLFRNIPRADLEMLLPNVEVRMTRTDRALLGVPAVAGAVIVIATKLGASLLLVGALLLFWLGARREPVTIGTTELVALGLGLAALATHLFRQLAAFKNRKIRFMKALADNLYFKNLDNDAGVFHRVVDAAEEEEVKEAVLGYCFLLHEPGLAQEELDARIEAWFREQHATELDFEVDDALEKLLRLQLVTRRADGRLAAVPVDEACRRLDERWDNYFPFANDAADAAGASGGRDAAGASGGAAPAERRP